jgi:hypothetical protein
MSLTTSRIVSWRRLAGLAGAAAVTVALVTSTAPAMAAAKAPVVAPVTNGAAHLSGPSAITASVAPPAAAKVLASQDGYCDVGDVCLYYFSAQRGYGSLYDTGHNDPYLFNNHFISSGSGQGSVVGNNAEAVWNRDPHTTVWLCTGTYSTGSCGYVAPNSYGTLGSTWFDKTQSLTWADSSN